ncbi:sensor histidine kinase [Litorimonas sp. RW-G-Af-16]
MTYIAVSVLAWIFAYFAIWMTTDKLVFSHLRSIKSASDRFSTGDLTTRVGLMTDAPSRIQDLGLAFDNMAENISDREMRLLDNLQEKETLLREIHHRVKNNLQIIISLLNMQERKLKDPKSLEAIHETRSRINAISLVHRGLYEGNDLRVIDMPVFLSRLVNELQVGLLAKDQNVTVKVDIHPVQLEPDTAIPVALFIVEALTNAMKHGVKSGGVVDIKLEKSNNHMTVSVADDGPGSHKNAVKGTGSKLMAGFARQLSGSLAEENTPTGYRVMLTFQKTDVSA